MKALTQKLNERINTLTREDYMLLLYCIALMISWTLDSMYCKALANYHGCQVGETLYYDKTIWMILIGLIFSVVDFFFGYKIWKIAHEAPAMEITITNGFLTSVKGLKKLLKFPASFVMLISIIAILYDICSFF